MADLGMTKERRYCPNCGADWRAQQIPEESVRKGYYGHREPCQAKHEWDDHFDPNVSCTCPPRFYTRLAGVEYTHGYDGVSEWVCPDCGGRWSRWTGKELKHGEKAIRAPDTQAG